MNLDFVKPRWRLHLIQSDTGFGAEQASRDNLGTTAAPLSTMQQLPNRRDEPAGVLRVQATGLGVVASDWLLGLYDGDEETSGNDPSATATPLLQLGTSDGTESVPPTQAILHLTDGQLGRLSYFAINSSGNAFSFLFDFWTYADLEAAARRMNGVAESSGGPKGCGC